MTQAQLAAALGVTSTTLARWERGEQAIGRPGVVQLALERLEHPFEGSDRVVASRVTRRRNQVIGNNLRAQFNSFVGRQLEVAEIRRLLAATQLVTITGTGGVGKTRLAAEVASRLKKRFDSRVWFVDLAVVGDAASVPAAIAHTLGLHETSRQSPADWLKQRLSRQPTLMVLDNLEQVIDAAPMIAELLAACSKLKVLITSREALRIGGEQEFSIWPLPVPDEQDAASPSNLANCPSVALLVDRVQAVNPAFRLTETNARPIAEVCYRLEGLPLALELAAAWSKVLSPEAMAARLQQRLGLPTHRKRDVPSRHQSLRAAISWSYDLLAPTERALFRRLAVFAGGCTVEAVTGIWMGIDEAGPNAALEEQQMVLESLASLIDKNLVRGQDRPNRERRFRMLDTIREFALEQLEQASELAEWQRRHAAYFVAHAERAETELTGPSEGEWCDRLEAEHDNLRAALRWSLDNGAVDAALRLGGALFWFWYTRGHLREGSRWLGEALARANQTPASVRAKALRSAAGLLWPQGNVVEAQALAEEGFALSESAGDMQGMIFSLVVRALAAQHSGYAARGIQLMEHAVKLARQYPDEWYISSALHTLAIMLRAADPPDLSRAAALFEESLELARGIEAPVRTARTLDNLGYVVWKQGDNARAEKLLQEALIVWRGVHGNREVPYTVGRLGLVAGSSGRAERAVRLFGAAEALRESIGLMLPPDEQSDHQRTIATLRCAVGEDRFGAVWASGRAMKLDSALVYALAGQESAVASSVESAGLQPTGRARLLTSREREVAALVARGLRNRQIGDALVITEGTAALHVRRILNKLGFSSRAQLAGWIVGQGLVAAPPSNVSS